MKRSNLWLWGMLGALFPGYLTFAADSTLQHVKAQARGPNIVIILCDDLGYGDLSIQGHPLIRTPNIDRLAREGQRWTSFYSSAPVCGPSRVALMTGRMPIRMSGNNKNDWLPYPLPASEITLGEMLKKEGYATCYVGKWGVAGYESNFDKPHSHPNKRGFDYFFGLIGSNDVPVRDGFERTYENIKNSTSADFPTSLYRQRDVIETPAYQPTLTKRYTEESVKWIRQHSGGAFFLYVAHSMPHVPIFASPAFRGHSKAGLYGDVVEELDWSVGQIMTTLREAGVAENTLVIFSSDNGPWRTYYDLGGSAGPWRDGKLTGWEGAFRVPGIFWWPARIKPAVIDGIGVNVDLMRTLASLTGASLPANRTYDSMDLSPTLLKGEPSPRKEWFFYGPTGDLWGARVDNYKLVYESWDSVGMENTTGKTTEQTMWSDRGYGNHEVYSPPRLFNLSTDLSERLNVADRHPDIVTRIQEAVERHRRSLSEAQQEEGQLHQ